MCGRARSADDRHVGSWSTSGCFGHISAAAPSSCSVPQRHLWRRIKGVVSWFSDQCQGSSPLDHRLWIHRCTGGNKQMFGLHACPHMQPARRIQRRGAGCQRNRRSHYSIEGRVIGGGQPRAPQGVVRRGQTDVPGCGCSASSSQMLWPSTTQG